MMRAFVTVSVSTFVLGWLVITNESMAGATESPPLRGTAWTLAALANARGARMDGTPLVLVGADGADGAGFDPQSRDLAGTEWQVTGYNTGAQAVLSVLAGTELSIRFSGDGKISGSAGCNDLAGTYTSSGQSLTIQAEAATRNTCEQPNGVMKQESIFLKALAGVALVRMEEDRLELRARNGALLVRAARSDDTRAPAGE